MRILVVDDNERVRRGVISILSYDSSYEVCGEAADGATAIVQARHLLPDIILLDISMPGISGLDVVRQLRQELPQTKFVIMSQHDPVHVLPRILDAGANACIDKGQLHRDLLSTMANLMQAEQPR